MKQVLALSFLALTACGTVASNSNVATTGKDYYGRYSACPAGQMQQRASTATSVRGMLQDRSTAAVPSQRFNAMTFSRPAAGGMGHPFHIGDSPITGYPHEGFDFGAGSGDPIRSITSGVVAFVMSNCAGQGHLCGDGWGNHVIVDHGGNVFSRYAHLSRVDVRVNQVVQPGDLIGAAGTTGWSDGVHLHMEIGIVGAGKAVERCKPTFFKTVFDPAPYLGKRGEIATLTPAKLREKAQGKTCAVLSSNNAMLDATSNVRDENNKLLATLPRGFNVKVRGWKGDKASIDFTSDEGTFGGAVGKPAFIDVSQLDLGSCQ